MSRIQPFRALTYNNAGAWDTLCCPPYDVVSEQEQRVLEGRNPHNAILLERPLGDDPYKTAKKRLDSWLGSGILQRDEKPAYYMMEMDFTVNEKNYTLRGFTARLKLSPFSEGKVLPHEETLSKAKADRLALMEATGCTFSAIYCLYNDDGAAGEVLTAVSSMPPDIDFSMPDGVTHRLWRITDERLQAKLTAALEDKQAFIADGHHRYETALKYSKENTGGSSGFVPMMLVSMDNPALLVLPTHRVVRDLPDFDLADLIEKCREFFYVKAITDHAHALETLREAYDKNLHAFALYADGTYTLLILKEKAMLEKLLPEVHETLRSLDVTVLHSLILERILGIDKANMAAQINLTYVKATGDALTAVDTGSANCAFLMNATRVGEISDVALSGFKMPQKSTYFYPKLTTGLVINRIVK
jgi:uncharacterized protein (DUF1015 family)